MLAAGGEGQAGGKIAGAGFTNQQKQVRCVQGSPPTARAWMREAGMCCDCAKLNSSRVFILSTCQLSALVSGLNPIATGVPASR